MHRRTFLGAPPPVLAAAAPLAAAIPIIDTHIHLFDPNRPQGVPWPGKDNPVLYQPALPDRYRKIAVPLGINGAIEVEASPWLEDNQWVLDVAAKDTIIVGTVGDLEPGQPDFAKQLERFHRNPLFRGIRYGNLWGRNFADEAAKPAFIADLKLLAGAGLVMDTANPDPALIETVVRLTDRVPQLRVVLDHLPQCTPPSDAAGLAAYDANLRELGKRPNVYVKLSEIFRRIDGKVIEDPAFYRAPPGRTLRHLRRGSRALRQRLAQQRSMGALSQGARRWRATYFNGKSRAAQEKYFWKNSVAAYRWVKRESGAARRPAKRGI